MKAPVARGTSKNAESLNEKSHTILGTKTTRGLTQMALETLFKATENQRVPLTGDLGEYARQTLAISDVSEAQLYSASAYLEELYGGGQSELGCRSRAQTPMVVGKDFSFSYTHSTSIGLYPKLPTPSPATSPVSSSSRPSFLKSNPTRNVPSALLRMARDMDRKLTVLKKDCSSFVSTPSKSRSAPRLSTFPQAPSMDDICISADSNSEYAIIVSMYEVYNDRIYDLLTASVSTAKVGVAKRRALLFKSTETSPDRKVVAGLRKVACNDLSEALVVLETGLIERRVAGTGSNAVSSRSHGFFCVEVKKRQRGLHGPWTGNTLTIVDLAGSERARNAKTAGATLAEAGKINESLMYLGQCMQMQSENHDGTRVSHKIIAISVHATDQESQRTWFHSANANSRNCSSPTPSPQRTPTIINIFHEPAETLKRQS
jgi:hypothetical protein